jgi:hypothetical protein
MVDENTEPVCGPIAAAQKEGELQRFVDQNLVDLSEGCVKADDTLLNRICRSPLRSGKTQATLGDMF